MVTKGNDESVSPNLSFKVLSLAAKLASKLSISLTVAADARPLKSSRHVDEKSKPHFKPFLVQTNLIPRQDEVDVRRRRLEGAEPVCVRAWA